MKKEDWAELKTGKNIGPNPTPEQLAKVKTRHDKVMKNMSAEQKNKGTDRLIRAIEQWEDFEYVLNCQIKNPGLLLSGGCGYQCKTNKYRTDLCAKILVLITKHHNPIWQDEVFHCVADGYLHSTAHKLEGCCCPAVRRSFCKELIRLEFKHQEERRK